MNDRFCNRAMYRIAGAPDEVDNEWRWGLGMGMGMGFDSIVQCRY